VPAVKKWTVLLVADAGPSAVDNRYPPAAMIGVRWRATSCLISRYAWSLDESIVLI
jgi:hypothetical protein